MGCFGRAVRTGADATVRSASARGRDLELEAQERLEVAEEAAVEEAAVTAEAAAAMEPACTGTPRALKRGPLLLA